MKSDFLIALTQLAAERNLPRGVVLSAIEAALVSAYRKDNSTAGQNIAVKLDPASGEVTVSTLKNVVEEVTDPQLEVRLADARKIKPDAQIGETVATDQNRPYNPGRIAAQTAKQVVMQRLREAERELVFQEYTDKQGEVFSVNIQRIEPKQLVVDLGRAEAVMPKSEQSPNERYRVGQKVKVLLQAVVRSTKGPELIVSRADKLLVKRLFEMEVPEIFNGAVEIVAIAREPGSRSKVAVRAKQDGVDPVGSCVGLRGVRIQNIVNELQGEKIDVVEWSKEPTSFIANALSPSQVLRVELKSDGTTAIVVVPDRQLSLAIGKEGQNARLAAKLTGWKVDIKSNVEFDAERVKPAAQAAQQVGAVAARPRPAEKKAAPLIEVAAAPAAAEAATVVQQPVAQPAAAQVEAVVVEAQIVKAAPEAVIEMAVPKDTEPALQEAVPEAAQPQEVLEAIPELEEIAEALAGEPEAEEEVREPIPALDRSTSLRDLPEDVWSLRRARGAPEPGRIRFAEDIVGLRGGVTASRRGRTEEDEPKGVKRKPKPSKKRR